MSQENSVPGMESVTTRAAEWVHKAEGLVDTQSFEQAIVAYTKAIFLEPRAHEHYVARGKIYLRLCDFQTALVDLRKAFRLSGNAPQVAKLVACVYFIIGRNNLDDGKFDEALESLNYAIAMDPTDLHFPIFRMKALVGGQRYEAALLELNKILDPFYPFRETKKGKRVLKKDPPKGTVDIDLVLLRCRLELIMNRPELAQSDVMWAHHLSPEHPELKPMMDNFQQKSDSIAASAMGNLLSGNTEKALANATKAISLNPNKIEYYKLRAAIYRKVKNFDGALTDLKEALSIFMKRRGNYTTAANEAITRQDNKGLVAKGKAKPLAPAALQATALMSSGPLAVPLDKAIEQDLALTFSELALEYCEVKQNNAALSCLSKAIELHPDCSTYYIHRGDLYRQLDHVEQALHDYQKASELGGGGQALDTRCSVIHFDLGLTLYNTHNHREAVLEFTKAIDMEPRIARYWKTRGLAYYQLQDFARAFKDYKQAVDLDPQDATCQKLMAGVSGNIFTGGDRDLLLARRTSDGFDEARATGLHPPTQGRRIRSSRQSMRQTQGRSVTRNFAH